jgi:hypothetical protein
LTPSANRRNVDQHVASALGRRPLDKLTAEDIDLFYAALSPRAASALAARAPASLRRRCGTST